MKNKTPLQLITEATTLLESIKTESKFVNRAKMLFLGRPLLKLDKILRGLKTDILSKELKRLESSSKLTIGEKQDIVDINEKLIELKNARQQILQLAAKHIRTNK